MKAYRDTFTVEIRKNKIEKFIKKQRQTVLSKIEGKDVDVYRDYSCEQLEEVLQSTKISLEAQRENGPFEEFKDLKKLCLILKSNPANSVLIFFRLGLDRTLISIINQANKSSNLDVLRLCLDCFCSSTMADISFLAYSIENGLLNLVEAALKNRAVTLMNSAVWILANMVSDSLDLIKELLQTGIIKEISEILQQSKNDDIPMIRVITWLFGNCMLKAKELSIEQIKTLSDPIVKAINRVGLQKCFEDDELTDEIFYTLSLAVSETTDVLSILSGWYEIGLQDSTLINLILHGLTNEGRTHLQSPTLKLLTKLSSLETAISKNYFNKEIAQALMKIVDSNYSGLVTEVFFIFANVITGEPDKRKLVQSTGIMSHAMFKLNHSPLSLKIEIVHLIHHNLICSPIQDSLNFFIEYPLVVQLITSRHLSSFSMNWIKNCSIQAIRS